MATAGRSSSQLTYIREAEALNRMPTTPGKAACTGNTAFDILTEKERIPREVRNQLARVCRTCPLTCGWRQVDHRSG